MSLGEVQELGHDELVQIMEQAPEAFLVNIRKWMAKEHKLFVGDKGSFTKMLRRKQRKYRDGNWTNFVAKSFTGTIKNGDSLDGIELRMGIRRDRITKVPWLQMLGTGGTITPKNAKWLIMPFYKNLMSASLFGRYGGSGKRTFNRLFQWMMDTSYLQGPVLRNGKLLYFGDIPSSDKKGSHFRRHIGGLDRKLLFVGAKKSNIPQQFNFAEAWEERKLNLVKRGQKVLQKTVDNLESGKQEFDEWQIV